MKNEKDNQPEEGSTHRQETSHQKSRIHRLVGSNYDDIVEQARECPGCIASINAYMVRIV